MKGRIHSIESMGLVDGPGIRTVVFLQGCNLRCIYCHNPDTWEKTSGKEVEADDIIKKIIRFKPYFKDNGGVTFSGGEPLLQKDFLLELLKGCKKEGIHTCIDTAGGIGEDYSDVLEYTDLILYDIKHHEINKYKNIVRVDENKGISFLKQAQEKGIPMWIRHVVVPEITDSEEHIRSLAEYIKGLKNIEKVELLPFHQLGANKYQGLDIEYPLKDIQPMNKEKTKELEAILHRVIGG